MKIKHSVSIVLGIAMAMLAQRTHAGWNYGSRSNCHVLAKYRVEIHSGWTASQGGAGNILRDTGCTYAHAGPLRWYASNGTLISEAEGYIGNSAFWGYAHSWNVYDGLSGILKKGFAAEPPTSSEKPLAPPKDSTQLANESRQSASNHFYVEDVRFGEPKKPNQKCITIKNITGNLIAGVGYSLVEIIVWKPKDDVVKKIADAEITPAKTIWRCRAVVHENRLTTEGEFPKDLFVPAPPLSADQMQKEAVYVINNKNMTITLPAIINLDEVEVCLKGDTGDESILQPKR